MYAAQISGDLGLNPLTAIKKGVTTVAKTAVSAVKITASASKGAAAAYALCKMPYASRLTLAKAAGVDTAKLDMICTAAQKRDYATLAVLTPDILKLLSKAPKSVQDDAATNVPEEFKPGKKKAGLKPWQWAAIIGGGVVVAGGAIALLTRPRAPARAAAPAAPAAAAA